MKKKDKTFTKKPKIVIHTSIILWLYKKTLVLMKMTKPDFDAKKQPKKLKENAKIYQKSMWTCQKIREQKKLWALERWCGCFLQISWEETHHANHKKRIGWVYCSSRRYSGGIGNFCFSFFSDDDCKSMPKIHPYTLALSISISLIA